MDIIYIIMSLFALVSGVYIFAMGIAYNRGTLLAASVVVSLFVCVIGLWWFWFGVG